MARGWGSARTAHSPSFVLVHKYKRADGKVLYHLDVFRLKPGEGPGLEIDTALDHGAMVVEWSNPFLFLTPVIRTPYNFSRRLYRSLRNRICMASIQRFLSIGMWKPML
jgi:tRNA A37 threonylcarbamoyladenosine biosynthesis protein TsaE